MITLVFSPKQHLCFEGIQNSAVYMIFFSVSVKYKKLLKSCWFFEDKFYQYRYTSVKMDIDLSQL